MGQNRQKCAFKIQINLSIKIAKAASRPKPEDYNLPRSQIELDKLLSRMRVCGIDADKAMVIVLSCA